MVRNALKVLLFSITLLSLVSCSISPTYSRKNVDKIIVDICKEEFNIDVTVWDVGETVWVYASLELLNEAGQWNIDESGKWEDDISGDIRRIQSSLSRVFLSIDRPPKFYCFVKSNTKRIGLDYYMIVFLPDQMKYIMQQQGAGQYVSQEDLNQKIVHSYFQNPKALGDIEGSHIEKYDVNLGDFIALLIEQSMEKAFLSPEVKDNFKVNFISANYLDSQLNVNFDIMVKKYEEGLLLPMDEVEKMVKKIIHSYASFHNITKVKLSDDFNEKIKNITFKAVGPKVPSAKEKSIISKVREAKYYIKNGNEHYKEKKYQEAAASYLEALSVDKNNTSAILSLGNSYLAVGKFQEAIIYYKKILKLIPEDNATYYNLGLAQSGMANYKIAIEHFQESLKNNPENAETYYNIGLNYVYLKDYSLATRYYEKVLEAKPDHFGAYFQLGYVNFLLENYGQAIDNYEKAINIKPDSQEANYHIGFTYATINKHKKATEYYQRALEINEDAVYIYQSLGVSHHYLGQYDKAVNVFNNALALEPDNALVLFNLGYAYIALGEYYEAKDYLVRAIEIIPDYAAAYFNLGIVNVYLDQAEEAKNNFRQAKEIFLSQNNLRAVEEINSYLDERNLIAD